MFYKKKNVLLILFFLSSGGLAFDELKVQNTTTQWNSLGSMSWFGGFTFNYQPNKNGEDKFFYSLDYPADYSQGKNALGGWINIVPGLVGLRLEGNPASGHLTMTFGRWYDGGRDGVNTGTVYLWHNDKEISKVNFTYHYYPWVTVTVPSDIIDLGYCHKYQSSGISLSKTVNIGLEVHGYTNGTYTIERSLTTSNSPRGVYYFDKSNKPITLGSNELIRTSSQTPLIFNDYFDVMMKCDEAYAGLYSWGVSLRYSIP